MSLWLCASCVVSQLPTDPDVAYQKALQHYQNQSYGAAEDLLEEVLPQLRGSKEEPSALFMQADCCFHRKNYRRSAELWQHFVDTFPRNAHREEAMYKHACAVFWSAPGVDCDQTLMEEAVVLLEDYIDVYPYGRYQKEASEHLKKAQQQLSLHAFKGAKLYHSLRQYGAAVAALEQFQQEHEALPDLFRKAFVWKIDAQHQLCRSLKGTTDEGSGLREAVNKLQHFLQCFVKQYPEENVPEVGAADRYVRNYLESLTQE